jgi:hypothetical protein
MLKCPFSDPRRRRLRRQLCALPGFSSVPGFPLPRAEVTVMVVALVASLLMLRKRSAVSLEGR